MDSPVRTTKTILACILAAVIFLDYWTYSQLFYREPAVYTDVLLGTASAPNQYRVGVIATASFIAHHGHFGLRHAVTLLDGLSAAIAVYVLYALLRRSDTYTAASRELRWLASAAFVVLVQFYLVWLTWYQRPETLPTAALVALTLWLLTPRPPASQRLLHRLLVAAGLLLIAAAQSLVRADVTVALHLGVLAICLTRRGDGFQLPRSLQIAASLVCLALGTGIQFYLMHVAYPHATYGSTPVFQLLLNLTDRLRIIPFIIFLVPWAWTLKTTLAAMPQRRGSSDRSAPSATRAITAPSAALLVGSLFFLALWCVLGKIDEVRIFLPFALALAPFTAEALVQRAASDQD